MFVSYLTIYVSSFSAVVLRNADDISDEHHTLFIYA